MRILFILALVVVAVMAVLMFRQRRIDRKKLEAGRSFDDWCTQLTGGQSIGAFNKETDQEVAPDIGDIACQFEFICPKKWALLEVTDDPKIRFCHQCNEAVFLAENIEELEKYGQEGRCAAMILKRNQEMSPGTLDLPVLLGRVHSDRDQ